jgi:hypothetical protein
MILGACRGLVAVSLVLGLLPLAAAPASAQDSPLRATRSESTYSIKPSKSKVDVNVFTTVQNTGAEQARDETYGPIYIEDGARLAGVNWGAKRENLSEDRLVLTDLPGPWQALEVRLPRIPSQEKRNFTVTYRLSSGAPTANQTFRIGPSDAYACIPRQVSDEGSLLVKLPASHSAAFSGTPMTRFVNENVATGSTVDYESSGPLAELTCVEATEEDQLIESVVRGPDGRQIVLQAGPENERWLAPAESLVQGVVPQLRKSIGQPIPGGDPLIVRWGPQSDIAGAAATHDSTDMVRLSDDLPPTVAPHELAHLWFRADRFPETWLREGLAGWAAGDACEPADGDRRVDLSTWQLETPTAPADVARRIDQQERAACAVVAAVADRMGPDAMQSVIASLLNAEEKYVSSGQPGEAASPVVDWREWLDAADERGLVPAGEADLDFAQSLLAGVGVAGDEALLAQRSEARQAYHALLERSAPLRAPEYVRRAMDDWRFDEALAGLTVAADVLDALTQGTDLLPDAGLVSILQGPFEGATDQASLESVKEEAQRLLGVAEELLPQLTRLRTSLEGWQWQTPALVDEAIAKGSFGSARAAIEPAIQIVEDLRIAEEAVPGDLHTPLRTRFEGAASIEALETLAGSVAELRAEAQATGDELRALEADAGAWTLPPAVSDPLARGQVSPAYTAIRDARVIVQAVTAAREALPEARIEALIRPAYETAATATALREVAGEATRIRDDAVTTGTALATLRSALGDWRLPTFVLEPVAARDFETAKTIIAEGQAWIDFAIQADTALPDVLNARASQRTAFEGATSIEDLEAGRQVAERQAEAAVTVGRALQRKNDPRDLLTQVGLSDVKLDDLETEALDAARKGDVAEATRLAAEINVAINGASRSGGLRVAGVVFFALAVFGVLGLWLFFRRERKPPWARTSRPPWARKGGR